MREMAVNRFATAVSSRCLLSATVTIAVLAQAPSVSVQASVNACEPDVPVCGVMSQDRLQEFPDRCAAQRSGAEKVLVGPCYDAD